MAKTTNFNEVFSAVVAQQTIEIGGKIEHAAEVVNSNTAGAVAQQTIEIGDKIERATEAINSNTAGVVVAGTQETVEQVKESEGKVISAMRMEKEPWFVAITIISAIALAFLLLWVLKSDAFLVNDYDVNGNLVNRLRDTDPYTYFSVVLVSIAYAFYMIKSSNLGLKKDR